jgi:penicillin amidase
VTYGPSYRQIIDLSDFENSISVITSGESGHFLSRFYDDQTRLWLESRYHPMLYNRQAIEARAEHVLLLEPSSLRDDREE